MGSDLSFLEILRRRRGVLGISFVIFRLPALNQMKQSEDSSDAVQIQLLQFRIKFASISRVE